MVEAAVRLQDPAAAAAGRQSSTAPQSSNSSAAKKHVVAFSADLGVPPVEAEVAQLCRAAAEWWQQQQGAQLVEAAPDLQDMQRVFKVGVTGVHSIHVEHTCSACDFQQQHGGEHADLMITTAPLEASWRPLLVVRV